MALTIDDMLTEFATDGHNDEVGLEYLQAIAFNGLDCMQTVTDLASREPDKKKFLIEIERVVLLVATRGTNLASIKMKTNAEGAKWVKAMEKKYKLVSTVAAQNASTKGHISMGRVAACFPELISVNLALGAIKPLITEGFNDLPLRFKFGGAPAMMTADQWNLLKNPFLNYMVAVHKIINAKKPEVLTEEQILKLASDYANAVYGSEYSTSNKAKKLAAMDKIAEAKMKVNKKPYRYRCDTSIFAPGISIGNPNAKVVWNTKAGYGHLIH